MHRSPKLACLLGTTGSNPVPSAFGTRQWDPSGGPTVVDTVGSYPPLVFEFQPRTVGQPKDVTPAMYPKGVGIAPGFSSQ